MALAAYRDLLRAARIAFPGDLRVMTEARRNIRDQFNAKANLQPSDPSIAPAIQHAQECARFLRQNVVQGKQEGDRYKLRIHEHTERGDNDTIKLPTGETITIDGKLCSDR